MPKQPDNTFFTPDNIERICSVVYFNRWLISICFLTGVTVAIAVFRLTPATYPSEAKLLVRYVSEAVPIASSSGNSVVAPGVNVINSEIAILESRDQIEKVVNELGLKRFGTDGTNETQRFLTIRNVLMNLSVVAPNNSNIISLRFDGSDPALAQDFLTTLIHHYLEKHVEIHRDAGAYEFLSKQTDQLRARLTDTEAELRALKTDTGIISLEDSAKVALAKVEDLERQQRETETALAASEAKAGIMRPTPSLASTNSRTVFPAQESPYPTSTYHLLVDRLKLLQNREAELLYSYMASSGPVLSIRAQITQTEKDVEAEFRKNKQIPVELTNVVILAGPQEWNLSLREEEAEVAALRAKTDVLKKQLTQAQAQSQHLASLDERMVQLQRNKDLQEQNYRYFSKRLEQARVDNALDAAKISSVVVIQPPSYPISKFRNKVPQRMGIALLFGFAAGLGLAFVRENVTHSTIKFSSEVTSRLGLPLMLSIPYLNSSDSSSQKAKTRLNKNQGDQEHSKDTPSYLDVELHNRLLPYYEALRDRIITRASKPEGGPYLLGIAGCHSGAGTSTIAAGLAASLARNDDGHILLVDANVDHASAHRLLPQSPASRMTSLLGDGQGSTIVIQPNLYMLSSCEATADPASIHVASNLSGLASNLINSKYNFVIFDLPPVNDISVTLRIAPALDSIVLILGAGEGTVAKATHANDLINQTGLFVMGAVLNKTKSFIPSFLGAHL